MSSSSWKSQLSQVLPNPHANNSDRSSPPRLAILGVGNELSGDDAAGMQVVRGLHPWLDPLPNVLLIEAGSAPENFTGPLRQFHPEMVLIIDAAHLDTPPGTIQWIQWEKADGLSASTHTLPPSVLATYLIQTLNCKIGLLGIQVQRLEMDLPLSPPVRAAVDDIIQTIKATLTGE